MAIASTARTRAAYIAETEPGVTPATPTFKEFRRTTGNLRTKKTTVQSDQITLDRNVRDEYMVGQDVEGSYDFEFSADTHDDILAGALRGTWATNVLVNGVTEPSFTFEETIDLGGSYAYHRFDGCVIDTLALSFASRKAITGSVNIKGQQQTLATAIISGATYTAATTTPVETAVNVASLTVAGASAKVRSLSLNIANNLRGRETVGDLYVDSFGMGMCDVTGTIEAYFESNTLYQSVLDHGGGAVSLTAGGTADKKYTFLLPAVKFLDGAVKLGGKNDDVMVSIPFRAIYDATTAGSIKITRAVA
jgi:hypothetical protein